MTQQAIKKYTVKEVAHELQTTERTVRDYIKNGEIIAKKVANKWLVTHENLTKYLNCN